MTVLQNSVSDHHVIYAETLLPVHDPSTVQIDQNLNPPSTRIEILDFNIISQIVQNSRSLLILLIGPHQ